MPSEPNPRRQASAQPLRRSISRYSKEPYKQGLLFAGIPLEETGLEEAQKMLLDRGIHKRSLQGEVLKGRVSKFDVWNERAVSHSSGLAVLFLGTGAGHPGEQRQVTPSPVSHICFLKVCIEKA